jgi:hypothetical protein
LQGQHAGAPAFRDDAGAFGRDNFWRRICKIAEDLPTDGRIRVKEPVKL